MVFYRRLSWDKPSPTITTSPHQKATDMCHPEKLRPLSVKECARLQTFPDNWVFFGSTTSKYRQIGNAVPVMLSLAIGEHIIKIIQGKDISETNKPLQLSLVGLNSINNLPQTKNTKGKKYNKILEMNDKAILKILLKDAGVKRSSLLAEKISAIDKYIEMTEADLQSIQWVDKDGKYIAMVKEKEVNKILTKRDLYLRQIENTEDKKNALKETSIAFLELVKYTLVEIKFGVRSSEFGVRNISYLTYLRKAIFGYLIYLY